MDQLINTACYVILAWMVASTIFKIWLAKATTDDLKEELDLKIRIVKLENLDHHKTILAYDAETDQFLGQGVDKAELVKRIVTRFPNKVFIVDGEVFSALKTDLVTKIQTVQTQ